LINFTVSTFENHRQFIRSQRGAPLLTLENFIYRCERVRKTRSYWLCIRYKSSKCNGRVICQGNTVIKRTSHCHPDDQRRISSSIIEQTNLAAINLNDWYKLTLVQNKQQGLYYKIELELTATSSFFPGHIKTTISTTIPLSPSHQNVFYRGDLGDQLNPDAVQYIRSRRGHPLLVYRGYKFRRNGGCKDKGYWRCASFSKCPGRVTTVKFLLRVKNFDDLLRPITPENFNEITYTRSQRGHPFLIYRGYRYRRNGGIKNRIYWRCATEAKCPGRLTIVAGAIVKSTGHNHGPPPERFPGLDFIFSQRGHPLLVVDSYLYRKNRSNYWRCIRCTKFKCRSRLIVKPGSEPIKIEEHSHGPETEKISWGRTVMENVRAQTAGQKDMVFRMRQPHCKVDYVKRQKK
ncbi:FLYWCH-type zinc finger-containing protein 1-like, partial [Culex pipiens pallens]|uniref:FLYWCH-type zinc finger-containing protein 1-like n=1 Tax=Culex pipiens pallens TaxID=42434 RepID=UPI0022AA81ED